MVQEKTTDDYKSQKPGTCCSDWSLDPWLLAKHMSLLSKKCSNLYDYEPPLPP